MHSDLTAALATEHQQDLARTAAQRRRAGHTPTRGRHHLRVAIGRYFHRGPQVDQQPLCWTDLGAPGARAGRGGSL